MSLVLDHLISLLRLEKEEDVFVGGSQDLGLRQLYGGQVLAQSLSAASQTVDPERVAHSVHGYFLRKGDPDFPITFMVDRVRDGGAFSSRHVTARQNGQTIFVCSASFHRMESGFEHQITMPVVPAPETLENEIQILSKFLDQLPSFMRIWATQERSIEVRPVVPFNPINPPIMPATRQVWFKPNGQVPDIEALHQVLLAYISDFYLLPTTLFPYGKNFLDKTMQVASIDHGLWMHRPVDMNQWLLYCVDSPWAGNARGFAQGSIFTQDGLLVASVAQEGLIRCTQNN